MELLKNESTPVINPDLAKRDLSRKELSELLLNDELLDDQDETIEVNHEEALSLLINQLYDDKKTKGSIKKEVLKYCLSHGCSTLKSLLIVESIVQRKRNEETDNAKMTPLKVAKKFLHKYRDQDNNLTLRFYLKEYYQYIDGSYQLKHLDDIKSELTRFIQQFPDLDKVKIKSYSNDVLHHIESFISIPYQGQQTFWIDGGAFPDGHHVCLKNGLLNIKKFVDGDRSFFRPHNVKYFTTNMLPYEYVETSTCTRWLTFLNETFDDQEVIGLVQEWFGYNLIPDTTQHKFMILYGQGANGKSVLLNVLVELLGRSNVSNLSLEAFNPNRTFMLNALVNVLANINNEINEVEKTSEGLLKSYVCGELITIDRKHKDPIQVKPQARLTFASNVLPRFTDRSDGIWRRIILIPFLKQILDESKQDKRLSDPQFWIESGELNGIFLWSLEGLKRLKKNKKFSIPPIIEEAKNEYRYLANPILDFFDTHYIFKVGSKYPKGSAYKEYESWCRSKGNYALTEQNFSYALVKHYPQVVATKNMVTVPNGPLGSRRDRMWVGLERIDDQG